ncbi:MAG: cation diffusion facilitator family transporter [Saprospiraceae bacterium]
MSTTVAHNESLPRSNRRLLLLAIFAGVALMGTKFFAWWLTNSNAILTDALEGIINVMAGAFALYSLILAAKPRDENHPYGHGKVEFISAGFEGGMIFLAGLLILGKGIYNLFYPQPIEQLDVGIILVAVSGIVNFLIGHLLEKRGKAANSLILTADGRHLKSDAYSSIGLLAGLGIVYFTQIAWVDNVTAILFGLIILYTGFKLVRESVAGIMDEADYQLINDMVQHLAQHKRPNWIDVHNFRVIKYGTRLHVDCHVTVPYYFETRTSHDEVKDFERVVNESSIAPVELFVHVDPCEPPKNCTICRKFDCHVREADFQMNVQWTLENFMKNEKHHE